MSRERLVRLVRLVRPVEKGDKGDQGIPGIQGIQGIPGPGSTFTRVAGTPSASNDGQTKTATATCTSGVVVGGGVLFSGHSRTT